MGKSRIFRALSCSVGGSWEDRGPQTTNEKRQRQQLPARSQSFRISWVAYCTDLERTRDYTNNYYRDVHSESWPLPICLPMPSSIQPCVNQWNWKLRLIFPTTDAKGSSRQPMTSSRIAMKLGTSLTSICGIS